MPSHARRSRRAGRASSPRRQARTPRGSPESRAAAATRRRRRRCRAAPRRFRASHRQRYVRRATLCAIRQRAHARTLRVRNRRRRARQTRLRDRRTDPAPSSMPTDSRSSASVMPAVRRASGAIDACVIVAGCATRLSTPPSDSASEKHLQPVEESSIAASPPLQLEAQHRAESVLLARGERVARVLAQAGPVHARHRRMIVAAARRRAPRFPVRAHARRERAQAAQGEIAVERRAGEAETIAPTSSAARATAGSFAITAPPTTSLWPLMYFVVECTTTSAPSCERLLQRPATGRCCRPRSTRRPHARPAPRGGCR